MSKQNQVEFHKRKWQAALEAVRVEKERLIAENGEAVIGPQNPHFANLVMQEIMLEARYNEVKNA